MIVGSSEFDRAIDNGLVQPSVNSEAKVKHGDKTSTTVLFNMKHPASRHDRFPAPFHEENGTLLIMSYYYSLGKSCSYRE